MSYTRTLETRVIAVIIAKWGWHSYFPVIFCRQKSSDKVQLLISICAVYSICTHLCIFCTSYRILLMQAY